MMPPVVESLARRAHPQKPSWRLTPARLIHALRERASTGLMTLLLGSKLRRRSLKHAGVSLIIAPAPKYQSGRPVEML
jgi:hypothetical protein